MASSGSGSPTTGTTVKITSGPQLAQVIKDNTVVIIDFTAVWCGPCKAISPIYEKLSEKLSSPGKIAFTKCDVDENQELSRTYGITAMPTFLIFKSGEEVERVQGANIPALTSVVRKLAQEAEAINSTGSASATKGFAAAPASSSGGSSSWSGRALPKGYADVTDQVDAKGLDLMNANIEFGDARTLFEANEPSRRSTGNKGKGKDGTGEADWVESDTDEQLMLWIPFQSTVKVHTIQFTSCPPKPDVDDDETPSRPRRINIYSNTPNILSFDDERVPTQSIELKSEDWDEKTGTIDVTMRFVKFQNVSSLTIFFVDVEREGAETVRVDRIRIIGESGEKKDMGKLEKVGDLQGE
ncbi:PITH domain-containing protein [Morchella snyderi]|nr:PITH domain-containing protein [Morchella snyderi]